MKYICPTTGAFVVPAEIRVIERVRWVACVDCAAHGVDWHPDPEAVYTCTGGCGREMPRSAFGNDRSRPDGRNRRCRRCASRQTQRAQARKEQQHGEQVSQ